VLILTVIQGPDKGRKFELPANEPQLIGRSTEALPLNDNTISRRHAELTPDEGLWFIRDLNSQNGTYVNGVRIAERTKLRLGDQVRSLPTGGPRPKATSTWSVSCARSRSTPPSSARSTPTTIR
jgi:hypothetical protein